MPRGRPRKDVEEDYPVHGPFTRTPDGRKFSLTNPELRIHFWTRVARPGCMKGDHVDS